MVVTRTVTEAATSTLPRLLASSVMTSNAWTFSSAVSSYNSNTCAMSIDTHFLVQKFIYDHNVKKVIALWLVTALLTVDLNKLEIQWH